MSQEFFLQHNSPTFPGQVKECLFVLKPAIQRGVLQTICLDCSSEVDARLPLGSLAGDNAVLGPGDIATVCPSLRQWCLYNMQRTRSGGQGKEASKQQLCFAICQIPESSVSFTPHRPLDCEGG